MAVSAQALAGQFLGGFFANIFASALNMLDMMQILQYIDAGYPANLMGFYSMLSESDSLIPNPFSFIPHSSDGYVSKRGKFAYFQASVIFLDNM
eukprot:CAMPEP_0176412936 /NCGR_PEP_ID=MMETSP0127-20121128/4415_1 /TAXON_ID=938130 /ORGANISM="Platyophrya macrostoma, Strain WH" /LENGTH=93 /DNA_ID=CAMNT_0017792651 /DNA_START=424 /DNA_END=702 /DNA_ORIENTATION=-